ncbi:hypothetical protein BDQ17DRAFT_1239999 [Cyathus striatus]|nr:hypothetical protein BDQ17DRAFT_1239999 [Cyathus striatus]
MKFSFTTLLSLAALATTSLAAPFQARDVYSPKLLTPAVGTVWKVGSTQNITWDVSSPPAEITNRTGVIYLKKPSGLIDLKHPLAQGFDITSGRQEVTVPSVPSSKKYALVLMGDSGNDGPTFTIVQALDDNDADDFPDLEEEDEEEEESDE